MKRGFSILLLAAATLCAQPSGSVEGRVVSSSDGTPAPRAAVLLRAAKPIGDSASPERDSYLTETDAAGQFAINGVAPGAYQCVPSRTGFEAQPPNRAGAASHLRQITVADGQHVGGLVLRLTPLGVISGRVLDPEGQPVLGASVEAMQHAYSAAGKTLTTRLRATSDDRGQFRLFGLYPGAYYVRATPQADNIESATTTFGPLGAGYSFYMMTRNPVRGPAPPGLMPTYHPSVTDSAKAAVVDVPAGGEARSIEIRFQRRALYSIRGKVPPAAMGLPIGVRKRPADPSLQFAGRRIQGDGSFELPGLPSGSYVVTAMQRNSTTGELLFGRAMVEIMDRDVEGVEFEFVPGLPLSGVVKPAGTAAVPLESLSVGVQPIEGGVVAQSGQVKADGTFAISNITPDEYHVVVGLPGLRGMVNTAMTSAPATAYATSIKLGDAELSDGRIDLRRGVSETLTITISADMGRIDGKVTGQDGQPAPAAYVTLVPDPSKWDSQDRYQEMDADSQGRFVFEKVAPGRYTLFAWNNLERGAPRDADFRKPFEKLGVLVDAAPNGRQTLELKAIDAENRP